MANFPRALDMTNRALQRLITLSDSDLELDPTYAPPVATISRDVQAQSRTSAAVQTSAASSHHSFVPTGRNSAAAPALSARTVQQSSAGSPPYMARALDASLNKKTNLASSRLTDAVVMKAGRDLSLGSPGRPAYQAPGYGLQNKDNWKDLNHPTDRIRIKPGSHAKNPLDPSSPAPVPGVGSIKRNWDDATHHTHRISIKPGTQAENSLDLTPAQTTGAGARKHDWAHVKHHTDQVYVRNGRRLDLHDQSAAPSRAPSDSPTSPADQLTSGLSAFSRHKRLVGPRVSKTLEPSLGSAEPDSVSQMIAAPSAAVRRDARSPEHASVEAPFRPVSRQSEAPMSPGMTASLHRPVAQHVKPKIPLLRFPLAQQDSQTE
jgi:hypothetical protein